ncbi:MAG: hypothetical protein E7294_13180 [Lachnospiraceae bacterium]|jgi:hypothetical protein|nr:hypothetical protein [Lachnospiraceae bacterium]
MAEQLQIRLDVNDALQTQAFQWAMELCKYADMSNEFLADFWNRLVADPDVYDEFCYYLKHQDYSCHTKVDGYTVVDVLIWQMDRFKMELDMDKSDMKQNGDKMLLMAFDTFLKMRKEPDFYVRAMQTDTGTDYLGKY